MPAVLGNWPSTIGNRQFPSSSYWLSVNISVLRTALDKLGGLSVTKDIRTPKRPSRIPELLKPAEVERLIQAAPTLRDRLLIGKRNTSAPFSLPGSSVRLTS